MRSTDDWRLLLEHVARAGGGDRHAGPAFRDELGHRRPADVPFLALRDGSALPQAPSQASSGAVDETLWWACLDGSRPVDPLLAMLAAHDRTASDAGAIVPQGLLKTIEVWTETELSALHALDRLARVRGRPDYAARARESARWHIENVQPDNATNRPWAIHLFIRLSLDEQVFEAQLYAETLLHNCQVSMGKADLVSAQILADAASLLD